MSKKSQRKKSLSHKLGDKRNEWAAKHRKVAHNFSQSKDIHEDRGTRQTKLGGFKQHPFNH